jgi:hypothetical protein
MNGQWIGTYAGTNQGLLVVDLDDVGDHYDGVASALESNMGLPPTFVDLRSVPKDQKNFQLRVPLMPIDRATGAAVTWDQIKKNYPEDVVVPTFADTDWKVGEQEIELSWKTDAGTSGGGVIYKSRGNSPSELVPLPEVTTWEEFRRFARDLEPHRYIFRGQTSNRWRLRTSFHRTGRASLVKFMFQDIPVLHRHLSGMMANHLDLRDETRECRLLQSYPAPRLSDAAPRLDVFALYQRIFRVQGRPALRCAAGGSRPHLRVRQGPVVPGLRARRARESAKAALLRA